MVVRRSWRSEAPNYLSPSALMVAVYRLRLLGSARFLAALLATPKRLLTVLKWLPLSVGEAEVEWVSSARRGQVAVWFLRTQQDPDASVAPSGFDVACAPLRVTVGWGYFFAPMRQNPLAFPSGEGGPPQWWMRRSGFNENRLRTIFFPKLSPHPSRLRRATFPAGEGF